jgi:hypothetical protein
MEKKSEDAGEQADKAENLIVPGMRQSWENGYQGK